MTPRPHEPATLEQLVDAMVALGFWEGENTPAELQAVKQVLLDAAVDLAPRDQPLPDSATATFVLCGALAPLAAAASFLIALTYAGPSSAQLDSARRHVIVAVLHGDRGISGIPLADVEGDRWFLQAVAAVGELMARAASDPPVTKRAYTSFVTGRTLHVIRLCGAWLAHAARRHPA